MTIAITGATGAVGSRVAKLLEKPRLVVRDPAKAPRDADVRVASSYGARDEMRAALEQVDTLFLIPAAESADRVEQHKTAVDAAVEAEVERIVYLSFLNAAPDATFTLARDHWATEQHILSTGVNHAFLRMSLYLDFIPSMAGADGVIRGPAGDGRVAAILRDDVARTAAAVLASTNHAAGTYDLTGPEAFSLAEAAALLGVDYHDETDEEAYASRAHYGAPDWEVRGWVSSYQAIRDGSLDVVSPAVRELTGTEAVSLKNYLNQAA